MTNPISKDNRYTITQEWTGKDKPSFVLRYEDEFIACSQFYGPMLIRAIGLNAEHKGALLIRGIEEVTE